MTQDELIRQLGELRDQAREMGYTVAEDSISHAIDMAAKGKLPEMQRWLERAIASMRRSEGRG